MGKKTDTALAERPSSAIEAQSLDFLSQHEGSGFEHTGAQDVLMPRFVILQDLSPQINERKPEYIAGSKAGQIVNVATGKVFDEIHILPVFYERRFIEWKPNRGGFAADHGTDESIMDKSRRDEQLGFDVLSNGNLIVPTATWYGLDLTNGGDRCIIAMARTQIRASRQMMSFATSEKLNHPDKGQFTPPLFYRSYKLGTVLRDNGQNEWFVWAPQRAETVVELAEQFPGLMQSAIAFKDLLLKGEIKPAAESFAEDSELGGDNRGGGGGDDRPM